MSINLYLDTTATFIMYNDFKFLASKELFFILIFKTLTYLIC